MLIGDETNIFIQILTVSNDLWLDFYVTHGIKANELWRVYNKKQVVNKTNIT